MYEPIDEEFMDEYVEYIVNEQNKSDSWVYNCISAIKNFFRFLKAMRLIDKHYLRFYRNPYYNLKKKDRAFSTEDCIKLLDAAYQLDPFTKSYYVLVLLLFTCGLRSNEVCKLKRSQVLLEERIIQVTRGQKTNVGVSQMTKQLTEELRHYFSQECWINWSDGKDDVEVFSYDGKPLNRYRLVQMLTLVYKRAEFKRPVRVHDFRYSMVKMLSESGLHDYTIKDQLRHSRIKTTLHYMPPSSEIKHIIEEHSDTLKI